MLLSQKNESLCCRRRVPSGAVERGARKEEGKEKKKQNKNKKKGREREFALEAGPARRTGAVADCQVGRRRSGPIGCTVPQALGSSRIGGPRGARRAAGGSSTCSARTARREIGKCPEVETRDETLRA